MKRLIKDGRAPHLIVLENVCGTLSSHNGKDFATIGTAFHQAGYIFGALVVDASLFLPQSRPRLFIIGAKRGVEIPRRLMADGPCVPWHTRTLTAAYEKLSPKTKQSWIWWNLPLPPKRQSVFADMIEVNVSGAWFSPEETQRLLAMMSEVNRKKVIEAKHQECRIVGSIYKRTRPDEKGQKVQRAEIRLDDVAGCLRTPAGGSSRQVVIVIDGDSVKARLISSRETARLMGLPDDYKLPEKYNEAYHLTGDGVVVPVVRHLAEYVFEPLLRAAQAQKTVAA